jgi:hypothetical protein
MCSCKIDHLHLYSPKRALTFAHSFPLGVYQLPLLLFPPVALDAPSPEPVDPLLLLLFPLARTHFLDFLCPKQLLLLLLSSVWIRFY